MKNNFKKQLSSLFTLRWNPSRDLTVVLLSYILVVSSLYTATKIIGPSVGGGLPYFFMYALLTATIFGIGIPVVWMVIVCKRPLPDLGITTKNLGISLLLQLPFVSFELYGMFTSGHLLSFQEMLPLMALSLCVGLFEAIFWRGWVLMRLEEAFGFIPALLLSSALYAAYHVGYGMTVSEMVFLFFIGIMYAVAFRLTRSIFILWPIFQPAGQMITLMDENLGLPVLAALGFFEALILMGVLIFFVNRYAQKRAGKRQSPITEPGAAQ